MNPRLAVCLVSMGWQTDRYSGYLQRVDDQAFWKFQILPTYPIWVFALLPRKVTIYDDRCLKLVCYAAEVGLGL